MRKIRRRLTEGQALHEATKGSEQSSGALDSDFFLVYLESDLISGCTFTSNLNFSSELRLVLVNRSIRGNCVPTDWI